MTKLDTDIGPDAPQVNVSVDNNGPQNPTPDDTAGTTFRTRKMPIPEEEHWFKTYWRPAAAWLYLGVVLFDFVVAPVFSPIWAKIFGITFQRWEPLTLQGGGLFHLSFGAIIGVTSWGRTKERVSSVIQ